MRSFRSTVLARSLALILIRGAHSLGTPVRSSDRPTTYVRTLGRYSFRRRSRKRTSGSRGTCWTSGASSWWKACTGTTATFALSPACWSLRPSEQKTYLPSMLGCYNTCAGCSGCLTPAARYGAPLTSPPSTHLQPRLVAPPSLAGSPAVCGVLFFAVRWVWVLGLGSCFLFHCFFVVAL